MRRSELASRLAELEQAGLTRVRRVVEGAQGPQLRVDGVPLLAFCSNDYLGLAAHPALAQAAVRALEQYGVGSAASALVCGHMRLHDTLEDRLAGFVGLPRALHFSTGYMANLGVLPALAGPGDVIFSDQLNHASLIDAARLSRAEVVIYPHGDAAALEQLMQQRGGRTNLVVTDSVFSMDGDLAPVPQLLTLCERHDAWLVIDDAHGFGVLGARGAGCLSHWSVNSERIVYIGTLGKAAGVFGAFVAGEADVIEWILQRARTYVFTTATPPALAAALLAALELIAEEPWRRQQLSFLIERLREALGGLPWRLLPSPTPIQSLLVGENVDAVSLMQALRSDGIWVPAIRPPTVPAGTARLRISLSAAHSDQDVDRLARCLHRIARGG